MSEPLAVVRVYADRTDIVIADDADRRLVVREVENAAKAVLDYAARPNPISLTNARGGLPR